MNTSSAPSSSAGNRPDRRAGPFAGTVIAVPFMALASSLWQASALVIMERFGKAVRTAARDTMLSHAGAEMGRGKAFAIHEALDQSGALLGPLLVGLMVAVSGFQLGFGVLAIPGAAALVAVILLRRAAPDPSRYDTHAVSEPARAPREARVRVPPRSPESDALGADTGHLRRLHGGCGPGGPGLRGSL